MQERIDITILKKYHDIISKRIKNPVNGFDTVEEYVDYVLKEVLEDEPQEDEKTKKIEEKLKKLGYV